MAKGQFQKKSKISAPVDEVFSWHSRKGAFERLSPPWDPPVVIKKIGTIKKNDETLFKMKAGPIPIIWHAKHTSYEKNVFFKDEQFKGPFASWTHTHTFEAAEGGCILTDTIDYELPISRISGILNKLFVEKKLGRIFTYRHKTLINDLNVHLPVNAKPLNILISGASGVIGSALVPFLLTGGHTVKRLVRKPPQNPEEEIFWDPARCHIDSEKLTGTDVVIHLAGEHIGGGRWTPDRKRTIIESRTKGTSTLAKAIAAMENPPQIFLSASAIGYYGDCGDKVITEKDAPGDLFISEICKKWEASAEAAVNKGIRTVFMRIGVVPSPQGGALKELLLPFKMGLGGKIGNGRQYMSWVSIDDVLYAIHHAMFNEKVSGPVNFVSPTPVTNESFIKALGSAVNRPTVLPIPEYAIDKIWGEMGREVLLAGARVIPEKLIKSGYEFKFPDLEKNIKHMLGL